MSREQIKELAEENAIYEFNKFKRIYGDCTDEYVRHFYNKLAELRSGIDDVHACNCTNADRIRNMTDEELAEFLDIIGEDGISSQYTNVPCDCCYEKTECSKCWEEWLQSEAE
mgnify:CR=1 FL=1